jgi:predicted Rossmann fold flavoprotein
MKCDVVFQDKILKSVYDLIVIGGGAAGFFAAIQAAEITPNIKILILEGTPKLLSKVEISGGGRCNVTHNCFDPRELISHYHRGKRELLGPFSRFQPKDTIEWFQAKGVAIKTEADGRMFPETNTSQTIISCFLEQAEKYGIEIKKKTRVSEITKKDSENFLITTRDGEIFEATNVLLATGSSKEGHQLAESFGHTITELAPSLFTFTIQNPILIDLAGLSFPSAEVNLKVTEKDFVLQGPVLITHWGLSGPAILKLSSQAAKELFQEKYQAKLRINWIGIKQEKVFQELEQARKEYPLRNIQKHPLFQLQKRFWERCCELAGIFEMIKYSECSNDLLRKLANILTQTELQVSGKGEFKEEFVTCGGVSLEEIDFRTYESKIVSGLFFAGEILNIDGETGGFNFQNAWTGGWHVGNAVGFKVDTAKFS